MTVEGPRDGWGRAGWALEPGEGAGRSQGTGLPHALSTSREEFFGSPDSHERTDPGRFLRSHRDDTALPLPPHARVSTGVTLTRQPLLEPATPRLWLWGWTDPRPRGARGLAANTVPTSQGRGDYTKPRKRPKGPRLSETLLTEKAKEKWRSQQSPQGSVRSGSDAEHSLISWEGAYADPRNTSEGFPVSLCNVRCTESDK